MATHTHPHAGRLGPPPAPPAAHRTDAGPHPLVGAALVVIGAVGLFAAYVGYGLADGRLSAWDRLSEATSFGLPSSVVGLAGLVALVVGLALLGLGLAARRRT
jgi:hypothetical protein